VRAKVAGNAPIHEIRNHLRSGVGRADGRLVLAGTGGADRDIGADGAATLPPRSSALQDGNQLPEGDSTAKRDRPGLGECSLVHPVRQIAA